MSLDASVVHLEGTVTVTAEKTKPNQSRWFSTTFNELRLVTASLLALSLFGCLVFPVISLKFVRSSRST